MVKSTVLFLIITIVALFGLQALFAPGFYTSHDGFTHTARIANYYLALSDGQFPPRWAPNLDGNAGSPIFVYIYPLPYFVSSIIHSLGLSFTDSFKVTIGMFYIFSGWTMFAWLRRKIGSNGALVAAIFYLFAPYRFLMLFVRGAFAESIAYAFVPLVFLSIDKTVEKRNLRAVGFTAVSIACLMLSHNLVAVIFLPVAFIYMLIISYPWRLNFRLLIKLAVAWLLGILISAFIYVPDVLERDFTRFDTLISYYSDHFIYFWQFLRSPWDYGFSFSGPADAMSFQVGLAHLLVLLLLFATILFFPFAKNIIKISRTNKFFIVFCLLGLGVTFLLMLESPLTHFVWQKTPMLSTIDYPWRLLGLFNFLLSILAGIVVYSQKKFRFKIILASILVVAVLVANRNHIRVNQAVFHSDKDLIKYNGSATHLGEFTPKTRTTTDIPQNKSPVELFDGEGEVKLIENRTAFKIITGKLERDSTIRINTFYFPGWQATIDGHLVTEGKIRNSSGIDTATEIDKSGYILIDVPKGEHRVELKFTETSVRLVSDLVSLGAFLLAGTLLFL